MCLKFCLTLESEIIHDWLYSNISGTSASIASARIDLIVQFDLHGYDVARARVKVEFEIDTAPSDLDMLEVGDLTLSITAPYGMATHKSLSFVLPAPTACSCLWCDEARPWIERMTSYGYVAVAHIAYITRTPQMQLHELSRAWIQALDSISWNAVLFACNHIYIHLRSGLHMSR